MYTTLYMGSENTEGASEHLTTPVPAPAAVPRELNRQSSEYSNDQPPFTGIRYEDACVASNNIVINNMGFHLPLKRRSDYEGI